MRIRRIIALVALMAIVTMASSQQPKSCQPGEYRTMAGECHKDLTGETSKAPDGCNILTCSDPACYYQISTADVCLKAADDPVSPMEWIYLPIIKHGWVGITSSYNEMIITCDEDQDRKLHNCKITDGHTLDDVMQAITDQLNKSWETERSARAESAANYERLYTTCKKFLDDVSRITSPKKTRKP